MAALIVQQKLLDNKHILEEHEEQLRREKEQLELEGNTAATMAKMKVLSAAKVSSVQSNLSKVSDGMESYFERGQQQKKTVDAETYTFVPQIHKHGQIPLKHNVCDPQK